MDRKAFLLKLGALTAAASTPLLMTGCAAIPYVIPVRDGERLVVRHSDVGDQPFVLVDTAGLPAPIYLHQAPVDTFTAVLLECTHRGCEVRPAGERLKCPCHGSQFATDGSLLKGPASRDLARFVVSKDDQHIYIHLA